MTQRTQPGGPGHRGIAILDGIAAVGLFAMMATTVVDVIGRYVFNRPLPASYEVTEYLMGLLVFLALPVVTLRGEHVRITLIDARLGPRATALRDRVLGAVAAVVCATLAWGVIVLAARMATYGDGTQTLGLPLAPLAAVVAASLIACGAIVAIRPFLRR